VVGSWWLHERPTRGPRAIRKSGGRRPAREANCSICRQKSCRLSGWSGPERYTGTRHRDPFRPFVGVFCGDLWLRRVPTIRTVDTTLSRRHACDLGCSSNLATCCDLGRGSGSVRTCFSIRRRVCRSLCAIGMHGCLRVLGRHRGRGTMARRPFAPRGLSPDSYQDDDNQNEQQDQWEYSFCHLVSSGNAKQKRCHPPQIHGWLRKAVRLSMKTLSVGVYTFTSESVKKNLRLGAVGAA
jgi:hypothetical protein